jgi:hypothetical protein
VIWSISPVMTRNSRQSSVLVPAMRSTCALAPAAICPIGAAGMICPSITGWNGIMLATTSAPHRPGSGWARTSAFTCSWAVSSRSTGTAATASRAGGTPSFSARQVPIRAAAAAGIAW